MTANYRFDLVIANCNRSELFWRAFSNLKNFSQSRDRLIIMDCSDNPKLELQKSLSAIKILKLNKLKFFFLKRRNWNLSHGAQLDYIRLVGDGIWSRPRFTFFMQEHYLNKKEFVKGDTLPDDETIDLNEIYNILKQNNNTVFFCARNGFRISATIPDISKYGINTQQYNLRHLDGSQDLSFVIDGGNFCLDINHYLDHYKENKSKYTQGNGFFRFCHVWETRLCKILYDKGIVFYEKHRNLKYRTTKKMKDQYPNPGKIWGYFYNLPEAYLLYGQDIFKYKFGPNKLYLSAFRDMAIENFKYDRNTELKWLYKT